MLKYDKFISIKKFKSIFFCTEYLYKMSDKR